MKPNTIEFSVWGRYALFSDPVNRMGGEKLTYQVPTYEALRGIAEAIYWKPTIEWIIDEVRIMNPIRCESKGIRPIAYGKGDTKNTLSIYTYLSQPHYQVRAHFEWNENRPDLKFDRNENKHHNIAKRYLSRGGRRDVFLGTRECVAYVEPAVFGEGEGYYDNYGQFPLGMMFHGFTYPEHNPEEKLIARFWKPVMENGVISFIRPDGCSVQRELRQGIATTFVPGTSMTGVENFSFADEFGGDEFGMDA